MPVGINIPVNAGGIASAKAAVSALNKDTRAARKEMAALLKEGKDVEAQQKRIAGNEKKIAQIQSSSAVADARSRLAEVDSNSDIHGVGIQSPFRHAVGVGPFQFSIREKALALANSIAGRAGVQSSLSNVLSQDSMRTLSAGGVGALIGSVVGAVLPYAGAAGALTAPVLAANAINATGNPYSEAARNRRAEYAVRMSDINFTDSATRAYEQAKETREEMNSKYWGHTWLGTVATLGISNLNNALSQRRLGIDAYSRARADREIALRGTGIDVDAATKITGQRVYADAYGSNAAGWLAKNTWGKLKSAWGSNADDEAISESIKKSAETFERFKSIGNERAIKGDFAGAGEAYAQAGKEFNKGTNWCDPLNVWKANDQATRAHWNWAATQSPLPPLRIGE